MSTFPKRYHPETPNNCRRIVGNVLLILCLIRRICLDFMGLTAHNWALRIGQSGHLSI